MALESNGKKYPQDWLVQEMKVIYSKDPNKFYTFKLDKWIEKNQKLNAAITPGPAVPIDPTDEKESGNLIKQIFYLIFLN